MELKEVYGWLTPHFNHKGMYFREKKLLKNYIIYYCPPRDRKRARRHNSFMGNSDSDFRLYVFHSKTFIKSTLCPFIS